MLQFTREKEGLLSRLAAGCDNSPKGNIDAPILNLVELINGNSHFVTTSTCSGRISVFVSASSSEIPSARTSDDATDVTLDNSANRNGKGGVGRWALSSHAHLKTGDIARSLEGISEGQDAILKHEPAILHVRCIDMEKASWLLKVALGAGFRESGIVPGKTKVMVAIRTTATLLEIPLVQNGVVIASDSYLEAVEKIANKRFSTNESRLLKLEKVIESALKQLQFSSSASIDTPGAGGWVSKHSSLSNQSAVSASGGGSDGIAKPQTRKARRKEKQRLLNNGQGEEEPTVYRGKKWLRKNERKLKLESSKAQDGNNGERDDDQGSRTEVASHVWGASCANTSCSFSSGEENKWNILMFGGYGQEIEHNKKAKTSPVKVNRRSSCFYNLACEFSQPQEGVELSAVNIPAKLGKGGKIRVNADPTSREHATLIPIPPSLIPSNNTTDCINDTGGVSVTNSQDQSSAPDNVKRSKASKSCLKLRASLRQGRCVLLFGGRYSPKTALGDLWLWNGNTWCELIKPLVGETNQASSSLQKAGESDSVSRDTNLPKLVCSGEWPSARWGHTFTALSSNQFLLVGGRNESGCINESSSVYLLTICVGSDDDDDTSISAVWQKVTLPINRNESIHAPFDRFFHTTVLISRNVTQEIKDKENVFRNDFEMSIYGGWKQSHDVSPSADMVIFKLSSSSSSTGGNEVFSELKVTDFTVKNLVFERLGSSAVSTSKNTSQLSPMRRGGHSTLAINNNKTSFTCNYMMVFGGSGDGYDCDQEALNVACFLVPLRTNSDVIEVEALDWSVGADWWKRGDSFIHGSAVQLSSNHPFQDQSMPDGSGLPRVESSSSVIRCLLIGGGVPCFAFGPMFSEPCCLQVKLNYNGTGGKGDGSERHYVTQEKLSLFDAPNNDPVAHTSAKPKKNTSDKDSNMEKVNNKQTSSDVGVECVVVPSSCTKEMKVALESLGYLDKKLRISPYTNNAEENSQLKLASIPLTEKGSRVVDEIMSKILKDKINEKDLENEDKGFSLLRRAVENSMKTMSPISDLSDSEKPVLSSLVRCQLNNLPVAKVVLLNQRSKLESELVQLLFDHKPKNTSTDDASYMQLLVESVRNSTLFRAHNGSPYGAAQATHGAGSIGEEKTSKNSSKDIERVGDILVLSQNCLNNDELACFPWNLLHNSWKLPSKASVMEKELSHYIMMASGDGGDGETKPDIDPFMELWMCLTSCYGCRAVCRAARIDKGLKRQSQMRLLYFKPYEIPKKLKHLSATPTGTLDNTNRHLLSMVDSKGRALSAGPFSAGWVTVKENGLKYSFDISRVMFCSGNVTERTRMANPPVICKGIETREPWESKEEVVVDLYAGIGYYVVPFLVHHKVRHVHACEWNEDSLTALAFNLKSNGVSSDRYTLHAGDNRHCVKLKTVEPELLAPHGSNEEARRDQLLNGVADRVNLGLIPSSKQGWPLAVACIKSTGGWMHVHDNVHEDEMQSWKELLLSEFKQMCMQEGGGRENLKIHLHHVEKVKSYAPRIFHVVADIFLCL